MVQHFLFYPPPYSIFSSKSNEICKVKEKWSEILSTLSLLILVACFFFYSDKMSYIPGISLLLPCLSAAGIIYFSSSNCFVKRILSNPIMVKIGLLSYSLYLWHWVVITFFYYIFGEKAQSINLLFLQITLIISLSILGYFLIEKPIRYSKINFGRSFFFIYIIPSVILVSVNYYTRNNIRHWEEVFTHNKIEQSNEELKSKIIVIGDSHAGHLRGFLNYVGNKEHWKADILNEIKKDEEACNRSFDIDSQGYHCLYGQIKDYPIVFVSFFYDLYSGDYPVPRPNPKDFMVKDFYLNFERFIRDLAKDKQVYVFSNVPALSYSPLRYFRVKGWGLEEYLPPIVHMGNIQESNQKIFSIIKDIPNVHWVDVVPYLPNQYYTQDKVIYADQDHLTGFGSYQIGVNFHQHQRLLPSELVDSLYKSKN